MYFILYTSLALFVAYNLVFPTIGFIQFLVKSPKLNKMKVFKLTALITTISSVLLLISFVTNFHMLSLGEVFSETKNLNSDTPVMGFAVAMAMVILLLVSVLQLQIAIGFLTIAYLNIYFKYTKKIQNEKWILLLCLSIYVISVLISKPIYLSLTS